jgi:hypothetical protein
MAGHGEFWWSELMTRNTAAQLQFYTKLLGWTPFVASLGNPMQPAKPGEPAYTMFMKGETPIGGMMSMNDTTPPMPANVPAHWFVYFAVADIRKAVGDVKRLGGTVVKEPFEVKGVGSIAIIQDPDGAMLGIGQPAPMPAAAPATKTAPARKAAAGKVAAKKNKQKG